MRKVNFNRLIKLFVLIIVSSFLFFAYSFRESHKIGTAERKLAATWPNLPNDLLLGQVTGIDIDTNQNVFLFHRAARKWTTPFPTTKISEATILEVDGVTGKLLKSWGENNFIMPHGLTVDSENNVWIKYLSLLTAEHCL